MQNEDQRLFESMRSLELYTTQEIQTLQKAVVKRFEMIEEIVRTDKQVQRVQGQDLALPVHVRARDDLPLVLAT